MFLIFLNGMLTFFYITYFLSKLKKIKKFNSYMIALGMYTIIYGILPLMLLLFKDLKGYEFITYNIQFDYEGMISLMYSSILSLLGFLFLIMGYESKVFFKKEKEKEKKYNKIIGLTAWTSLAIGILSFLLWAKAYGSINNLIKLANAVRAGFSDIVNSFAFFKHPTRIVLFSCLFFFTIIQEEKRMSIKKIGFYIGFFISFYFSYLFLMASDGRLTMVLFLISFVWIKFGNKKYKFPIKSLFRFGIVALIALVLLKYMDSITYFIKFGEWRDVPSSLVNKILEELYFIPQSIQTAILSREEQKIGFTIVDDIITGIFSWVPTKFKPDGFQDVWNINTYLTYRYDGFGQRPCSLISQGYYDLGIFGVIFLSFLLGKLFKSVDRLNESKNIFKKSIGAYITIFNVIYVIPYCSFYSFMLIIFPIAVSIIIYKGFTLLLK